MDELLFDKIREPMIALPWVITTMLELMVSMRRLEKYFDSPEINVENFIHRENKGENAIEIKKRNFTWGLIAKKEEERKEKEMEEKNKNKKKDKKKVEGEEKKINLDSAIVLKDFELTVKKGEFVCIIGDVGSGKSSILSAIIGDLIPINSQQ